MAESIIKGEGIILGQLDTTKMPSGTTDNGCSIYRRGNVVTFNINIKTTSSNPVAISSGFIPNGFRPASTLKILLGDGSATGQTVGTIDPDGGIAGLYFGSTKYAQGAVTYIPQ